MPFPRTFSYWPSSSSLDDVANRRSSENNALAHGGIDSHNDPKHQNWSAAQYREAIEEANLIESMNQEKARTKNWVLRSAQHPHFATKEYMGVYLDDEIRHITDIYIERLGYIEEDSIKEILSDVPGINTSNQGSHREKIMTYIGQHQLHTLSCFKNAMEDLMALVGGLGVVESAGDRDLLNLVQHLLYRAPTVCCSRAFQLANRGVDFDQIWALTSAKTRLYQRMYRTKFVNMALKTYELRFANVSETRGGGTQKGAAAGVV